MKLKIMILSIRKHHTVMLPRKRRPQKLCLQNFKNYFLQAISDLRSHRPEGKHCRGGPIPGSTLFIDQLLSISVLYNTNLEKKNFAAVKSRQQNLRLQNLTECLVQEIKKLQGKQCRSRRGGSL